MKISSIFNLSINFASAVAFPAYDNVNSRQTWQAKPWIAPGPDDGESTHRGNSKFTSLMANVIQARGPCPGLNTLANHGYLPPNGREITLDILASAMIEGFNIARSDAILLFSQAVRTNPQPFARTFDLDTLGREGVLEHDFSLR
jgi:hypothetical protein